MPTAKDPRHITVSTISGKARRANSGARVSAASSVNDTRGPGIPV